MTFRQTTCLLLLLLVAAGCRAPAQHFDISVRNETGNPITIGLAKDGPPYEDIWATPEEVATEVPGGSRRQWGVTVQPGQTGYAGPVEGRFDARTNPWLRIYAGDPTIEQILAISRGSPNRVDVLLEPGPNAFIVHDRPGRLAAERIEYEPAP